MILLLPRQSQLLNRSKPYVYVILCGLHRKATFEMNLSSDRANLDKKKAESQKTQSKMGNK